MNEEIFTNTCGRVRLVTRLYSLKQTCIFMLMLITAALSAQTIKGKVIGADGDPIIGVNVLQKSTVNGTITDIDGNYSIDMILGSQVLTFTFIGYKAIELPTTGKVVLNITMEEDAATLDEVVVVGYTTAKKGNVLGSVASIKGEALVANTPVNAFEAVQGRLAGVQINTNGGPGAGTDIRIRGTSTFSGGVSPLFVVDGQQFDNIDNLDPNDIASIDVLKDGSTAAIYGSKAANGVVLITTKGGQEGDTKIEVSYTQAYSALASQLPLSNTKQRLFYETARATATPAFVTDSLTLLTQISNDLGKLLSQTGTRNIGNIAVSGGSKSTKFYWNTGFMNQEGIIINSAFTRINSSIKIDADVTSKIKGGTRFNVSSEFQKGLNENTVFQQMVERIPFYPVFEPDGSYTPESGGRQNPVAEALFTTRDNRNYRGNIFNYAEIKFFPYLTLRTTLGGNFRLQKLNNFDPTIVQTVGRPATGSESQGLDYDYQQENILTFRKSYNKNHNFNAFAAYSVQKWTEENSNISAISFVSDNISTLNNALELNTGNTNTTKAGYALVSSFGSISYDYKSKYLLNGVLRRDGSSRFGSDRRYGIFPSASVGWRLSEEPFMKGLSNTVSNLLVRYGYGEVGNERIGNYESRLLYAPGSIYNSVNGISAIQLANPNLGWESTISNNFGVDLSLFKGRITAGLDIWSKQTKDLLYSRPVPAESGFSGVRQNIGGVKNSGVEFTLGLTPYRTKNFEWSTDFNLTTLNNVVTELADPVGFQQGIYLVKVGESLGNMFGFVNTGIFQYDQSNAFSPQGVQLTPIFNDAKVFQKYQLNGQDYVGEVKQMRIRTGNTLLRGGDIIWKDLNNDFIIDDDNDRQVIGNGLAKLFGGLTNNLRYKNASLSFLFDYTFGQDIFRNYDQQRNDLNSAGETPAPDRIEGAWLRQGDVAKFASLEQARTWNRFINSEYVSKAEFIKLRFVRFNYSLPKSYLNSIGFTKSVAINVTANNLLTFTNYVGYNPELGSRGNPLQPGLDNLRYPNFRELILGIKIQL